MSEKAEDLELFHYGVKGMKWGVKRKSDSGGSKPGIRQRIKDRDESIQKARSKKTGAIVKEASAVNRSLKTKGSLVRNLKDPEKRQEAKSASEARRKATAERRAVEREANKMTSKEVAIRGATYAVPVILSAAYVGAGAAGTRRNAKIGEKFKNDMFADTKGLPAPGTIALNLVNGVWQ